MKPIHCFSTAYLERCKLLSTEEIVVFLENYRLLQQSESKSRLVTIRIPEPLIEVFKTKSKLNQVKYQTQIKKLMMDWVKEG